VQTKPYVADSFGDYEQQSTAYISLFFLIRFCGFIFEARGEASPSRPNVVLRFARNNTFSCDYSRLSTCTHRGKSSRYLFFLAARAPFRCIVSLPIPAAPPSVRSLSEIGVARSWLGIELLFFIGALAFHLQNAPPLLHPFRIFPSWLDVHVRR